MIDDPIIVVFIVINDGGLIVDYGNFALGDLCVAQIPVIEFRRRNKSIIAFRETEIEIDADSFVVEAKSEVYFLTIIAAGFKVRTGR